MKAPVLDPKVVAHARRLALATLVSFRKALAERTPSVVVFVGPPDRRERLSARLHRAVRAMADAVPKVSVRLELNPGKARAPASIKQVTERIMAERNLTFSEASLIADDLAIANRRALAAEEYEARRELGFVEPRRWHR